MKSFNVLIWNYNKKQFEAYDIMPYLMSEYTKLLQKSSLDVSVFLICKQFVQQRLQYRYWARCEYEFIASDWPAQRYSHKIDIYEQCLMNLDLITEVFIYNIQHGN